MHIDGMARLLSGLLDTQVESGQYGGIDEDRFRQALTIGPELSDGEQSLLLLSPVARNDFRRIKEDVRQELTSRLRDRGMELELLPLAAATDDEKVVMVGNGFTVTLYRQDDLGIPWVILVQIGAPCLDALNPMTSLRLLDSGGLEWLRGRPDANGEITGAWNDPETDLLARSRRFSLALEPV